MAKLVLMVFALCADAIPVGDFDNEVQTKSLTLVRRGFQIPSIDNAQDAWSDLISGVAPLVMLVGERVTKQHLRESMTRVEYYMLGASPLGLVTSMVSMLRLASIPFVARLIGRSDEFIRDACKEITPVNTGDVTSVLSMGIVQRGSSEIHDATVTRLHVQEFIATFSFLRHQVAKARSYMDRMDRAYSGSEEKAPKHIGFLYGRLQEGVDPIIACEQIEHIYTSTVDEEAKGDETTIESYLCIKVTAVGPEVNFLDGTVRSSMTNWIIVLLSVVAIFAVQVASLAASGWVIQLQWLLVVARLHRIVAGCRRSSRSD